MKTKELIQSLKIIVLGLVLSFGLSFASAQYTGPTGAPGDGTNAPTPLNVSANNQTKTGGLIIAGGNSFIPSGVATDSLYTVGNIGAASLKGVGERPVCTDENGLLKIC